MNRLLKFKTLILFAFLLSANSCFAQETPLKKDGFLFPKSAFSAKEIQKTSEEESLNVPAKSTEKSATELTPPKVQVEKIEKITPEKTEEKQVVNDSAENTKPVAPILKPDKKINATKTNLITPPKVLTLENLSKKIFIPQKIEDENDVSLIDFINYLPFSYEDALFFTLQELNNSEFNTVCYSSSNGRIIAENQEKLFHIFLVESETKKTTLKLTPVDGMYDFNYKIIEKLFENLNESTEDYLKSLENKNI